MLNRFIAIPALIVLLSACGGEGSSVSSVQTTSQLNSARIKVYHLAETSVAANADPSDPAPVEISAIAAGKAPQNLMNCSIYGAARWSKLTMEGDSQMVVFELKEPNSQDVIYSTAPQTILAGHEYYLFASGTKKGGDLRLKLTEKPAPVAKAETESVFRVANFNTGEKADLYIDGTRAQQDLEPDTLSEPVVLNKMGSIITSFVKPGGDASADEIKRCEFGHSFTESDGIAVYDPTGLCRKLLP